MRTTVTPQGRLGIKLGDEDVAEINQDLREGEEKEEQERERQKEEEN